MTAFAPSLDPSEVEKFSAMAAEWWNPNGKFGVLHVFNPVRLQIIKEQVTARLGRDPLERRPFEGLRFLDIGCGGGLLSEPMARLGAAVTGVDPSEKNIKTASVHAKRGGLAINYRQGTAEALADSGAQFDVVLALEVVEHVADVDLFLRSCGRLVKPGGLLFLSTLNRTAKAWVLAIAGAEYVLGWLPRGTHDWNRFLTPDELGRHMTEAGVNAPRFKGFVYDPLRDSWSLSDDTGVNYLASSAKP